MFSNLASISLPLLILLTKLSPIDIGGPQAVHAKFWNEKDWGVCPYGNCGGHLGGANTEYWMYGIFWGPCYCWVSLPLSLRTTGGIADFRQDYCNNNPGCPQGCKDQVCTLTRDQGSIKSRLNAECTRGELTGFQ